MLLVGVEVVTRLGVLRPRGMGMGLVLRRCRFRLRFGYVGCRFGFGDCCFGCYRG